MNISKLLRLSASAGIAIVSTSSLVPALAAEEPVGSRSAKKKLPVIEEIIVSARKRDESLMSTPVVVTALSAKELDRYKADDLAKIGEMVPTLVIGSYGANGGGSIALRGISSSANQAGFEQAVSVAIDGVQTSEGRAAQLGFFDLQQVEVLKGPQALFYGKNSPGGVIGIKTADPTDEVELSARIGYEFEAEEQVFQGVVSGPIADRLAARLALRYRDMDGWINNTAGPIANPFATPGVPGTSLITGAAESSNPEQETMGRLTLVYEGDNDLAIKFKYSFLDKEGAGIGATSQAIGPCSAATPVTRGAADPYGDCEVDENTSIGDTPLVVAQGYQLLDWDGRPFSELDMYLTTLAIDKSFGDLTLSSLTGFGETDSNAIGGLDQSVFSQLVVYEDQITETWSQEFRLTSNFDSPLNFMVGVFFEEKELDTASEVQIFTNSAFYNPAIGSWVGWTTDADIEGKTESAFGQLIYDVNDAIELSVGLRWTHEEKDMTHSHPYGSPGFGGFYDTSTTAFDGSNTIGELQGKFDDDNVSPEVTITWRPSDEQTVFLSYKTGYKSGGFGLTNPLSRASTIGDFDYDSEEVDGVELGLKGLYMDGQLRISASAFAYDFTDLQVNTYDPGALAYTINNAGELIQRGADLEALFQLNSTVSLHANIAYTHNRFNDFIGQCYAYAFAAGTTRATAVAPADCQFLNPDTASGDLTLAQDFDGKAPSRSPDVTGNIGAVFEFFVGNNLLLGMTADAYYSDDYNASEVLNPAADQDAFWRYNASISLGDIDDKWELALIGRNLSDEYYLTYAADRTGGTTAGFIGESRGVVSRGRELTLQASFKF